MMTNLSQSSSENNGQPRPEFPKSLRVLVIHDDPTDLNTLGQMLRQCQYNVTACLQPKKALDILREKNGEFDMVLCDVYMPDMDGFQLLENIKSEMNIPVIMMSAEDDDDFLLKLFNHGACHHLTKPVSLEAMKNIRKHLIKRKSYELKDMDNSTRIEVSDKQRNRLENGDNASIEYEGNWATLRREREPEEVAELEEQESLLSVKKRRVVWTSELHNKFVEAVEQLGAEKAVPKKILELMNDPGLTRENVASHLQKYRIHLNKSNGIQDQGRSDVAFSTFVGAQFNPMNSFDGFQAVAGSGERPPQALMTVPRVNYPAQRIVFQPLDASREGPPQTLMTVPRMDVLFNPEAQVTRPAMVQQGNIINQMNVLAAPMFQSPGNISRHQVDPGAQGFVSLPSYPRTCSSFPDNGITNSFVVQMNPRDQLVPSESNMGQQLLITEEHDLRYNYGHIPRPNIQNNNPNKSNCHPHFNSSTEPLAGRSVEASNDIANLKGNQHVGSKAINIDHGSSVTAHQDLNTNLKDGAARDTYPVVRERFLIPPQVEQEEEEDNAPQDLLFFNGISQSDDLMSVIRRQEEAVGQLELENNSESFSYFYMFEGIH